LDPAHGRKDLRLEICSHARQESHYSRSHAGPLHSNLLQMQVNVRFDPQPNSTCFAPRQQAKLTWLSSYISDSTIYLSVISTVSGMSSARDRCLVDRLWRQQSHIAPLADLVLPWVLLRIA
jgi:hypothetical protein